MMKRTQSYLLRRIADTNYLLPYGQLIADHRRGISLNDTGLYIWELLEKEPSREELRRAFLERFLTQPDEEAELSEDLDRFLDQLIGLGLIEDDVQNSLRPGEPSAYLAIAGLTLAFYGPRELVENTNLTAFRAEPVDTVDQRITVRWGGPSHRENGKILLRDRELLVCERARDFLLFFPTFEQINEVHLAKDGSAAVFYCDAPINETLEYQFFHALRHAFLYLAAQHGMYAIHSASLLYRERAWLFSASAGTGKSTHVNLWRGLYNVAPLNGDLNLLALEGGRPVVHGIPWCGTSGIFETRSLPLGGIVLLRRSFEDTVEELQPDKKALLVLQRFISPMWRAEQLDAAAGFAERVTGEILVCRLHCTKEPSAVRVMKDRIDGCSQNVHN